MRVLLDTNVVLDALLSRDPWLGDARALWQAADEGRLAGFVTATTLTDVFYVARTLADIARARQAVQVCLDAFEIVPVDRASLERAQQLSGSDLEDNVQIACVEAIKLDAIVTRDAVSFAASPIPVWSPAQCRQRLEAPV
jgi:predicted nucleic acid-binding protein